MHSSRMRTDRVLPVSPSMHCSGRGVPGPHGVPGPRGAAPSSGGVFLVSGGVPGPKGCTWSRGHTCSRGGLPPPLQTE